jgi:glycine cleavage system aminomethyltransferase T
VHHRAGVSHIFLIRCTCTGELVYELMIPIDPRHNDP